MTSILVKHSWLNASVSVSYEKTINRFTSLRGQGKKEILRLSRELTAFVRERSDRQPRVKGNGTSVRSRGACKGKRRRRRRRRSRREEQNKGRERRTRQPWNNERKETRESSLFTRFPCRRPESPLLSELRCVGRDWRGREFARLCVARLLNAWKPARNRVQSRDGSSVASLSHSNKLGKKKEKQRESRLIWWLTRQPEKGETKVLRWMARVKMSKWPRFVSTLITSLPSGFLSADGTWQKSEGLFNREHGFLVLECLIGIPETGAGVRVLSMYSICSLLLKLFPEWLTYSTCPLDRADISLCSSIFISFHSSDRWKNVSTRFFVTLAFRFDMSD